MMNFFRKSKIQILVMALILASISISVPAQAAAPISKISDLKVSFWPEYDNPSVLVIYRGKLPESVGLPARVDLFIPKNAKIASTASVDTNGQFQYDHAWQTHQVTSGSTYDELTFETIYQGYQCEIYYNPIGSASQRNFNFLFKTSTAVDNLAAEIQKPRNATDFKIEPKPAKKSNDGNFDYYSYNLGSQPAGRELSFKVSYKKKDLQTSMAVKPSDLASGQDTNNPGGRAGSIRAALLLLGIIGTGILVALWRVRSVAAAAKPTKRFSPSKPAVKAKQKLYCRNCGGSLDKKNKFCPQCGRKI